MKKRALLILVVTTVMAVVYTKTYHADASVTDMIFYRSADFYRYDMEKINFVLISLAILRSLSVFDCLMAERIESVSFLSMVVVRSSLKYSIIFQLKELLRKSGILYGVLLVTIVVSQFLLLGKVNDLLLIVIHLLRYIGMPFLFVFIQIILAMAGKDTKRTIVLFAGYYTLFIVDLLLGSCVIVNARTVYTEMVCVFCNVFVVLAIKYGFEKIHERKGDIL